MRQKIVKQQQRRFRYRSLFTTRNSGEETKTHRNIQIIIIVLLLISLSSIVLIFQLALLQWSDSKCTKLDTENKDFLKRILRKIQVFDCDEAQYIQNSLPADDSESETTILPRKVQNKDNAFDSDPDPDSLHESPVKSKPRIHSGESVKRSISMTNKLNKVNSEKKVKVKSKTTGRLKSLPETKLDLYFGRKKLLAKKKKEAKEKAKKKKEKSKQKDKKKNKDKGKDKKENKKNPKKKNPKQNKKMSPDGFFVEQIFQSDEIQIQEQHQRQKRSVESWNSTKKKSETSYFTWSAISSWCPPKSQNNKKGDKKDTSKPTKRKEKNEKDVRFTLLILIHTARSHTEERSEIRRTWGSVKSYKGWRILIVFLLGAGDSMGDEKAAAIERKLQAENEKFHDLALSSEFVDAYKNMSYKHVMGYKWAVTFCGDNADAVIKSDDDIVIDIFKVIDWLNENNENKAKTKIVKGKTVTEPLEFSLPLAFFCRVYINYFPHRNTSSKFFLSKEEYPRATFPVFCSGGAYITTPKVIKQIHDIIGNVKRIWLDDVFITGLGPEVANNGTKNKAKHIKFRDRSEEYVYHNWDLLHAGMSIIREWCDSDIPFSPWTFYLVEHSELYKADVDRTWKKITKVHKYKL